MANEAPRHIVFGISNKIPAINSAIPIPILPKGLAYSFKNINTIRMYCKLKS